MRIAVSHYKYRDEASRIRQALADVGLEGFASKKIYQCSGGEQQRIAIARLLMKPCALILADEPTGNLDEENKEIVLRLLTEQNREGKAMIIVTHDRSLLDLSDRNIELTTVMQR